MRHEAINLLKELKEEGMLKGPILDIGCTSSEYQIQNGHYIKDMFPHLEYIGLDINPNPGVDIVTDAIGYALTRYNRPRTAILTDVLEHSKDPVSIVQNTFRNLKEDGIAICTVHDIEYRRHCEDDYFRFTLNGLKAMFEGWKVLRIGQFGKDESKVVDHYIVAQKKGVYLNAKN
jgi:hypothetical protein